jgi:flagellar biosynthesis anti-sigma factor FlgM
MKIDDLSQNLNQMTTLDPSANKPTNQEKKPVSEVPEKTDLSAGAKVDFSNTSVEFSRAAEEMEKMPEERLKRIDELKKEIRNDTYHVDSNLIAEKIVDDTISDILGSE